MKRAIQRRQNHIPLSLVMDNSQIRGMVALDLIDGKVKPYQCKAIILADEGYQGLWSNPSIGSGNAIAIAIRAGISPQNLHKVPLHPMVVQGTEIPIPFEILGAGGRYRSEAGEDIDPLNHEGDAVVDMRFIDDQHTLWFDSIRKTILDSTGLDISIDVVPVTHQVMETTGGLPVDEKGRVTIESGKMWATGVYAAGPSASTGFHTSSILPGNTMLENLYTGSLAGEEAGKWSLNCKFGGSKNILQSLDTANKRIENLYRETGDSVGAAETKLTTQAKSFLAGTATIESLIETAGKTAEDVRTTTNTRVMNQEIVAALRVQDLGTIAASFAM
jgi:succinate dehydrogenase/fumarate reductase flavoprotein subunit